MGVRGQLGGELEAGGGLWEGLGFCEVVYAFWMGCWPPSLREGSALIGATRASRQSCDCDMCDVIQP